MGAKKIVYIDMDNTFCNYTKRFEECRAEYPEVRFPQAKFGFFTELEPMPGALEAWRALEATGLFDLRFLTRPSTKNLNCYSEKAYWVLQRFGEKYLEILNICPDKSIVRGDYLVDDWDGNGQNDFMGEFIKFGTDEFPNWKVVVKYLIDKEK